MRRLLTHGHILAWSSSKLAFETPIEGCLRTETAFLGNVLQSAGIFLEHSASGFKAQSANIVGGADIHVLLKCKIQFGTGDMKTIRQMLWSQPTVALMQTYISMDAFQEELFCGGWSGSRAGCFG